MRVSAITLDWKPNGNYAPSWFRFKQACTKLSSEEVGILEEKERIRGVYYKLKISVFVTAFCKYLKINCDGKLTKEDRKCLTDYVKSETCKAYFKERVVGNDKLLRSERHLRMKDFVFAHLETLPSFVTFKENRENGVFFIGKIDNETLFGRVKQIIAKMKPRQLI